MVIMAYTNSKLATYTRISPFKNSPRNQPITKITIHHMAGVLSLEQFGNIVTTSGRNMSANYAIDKDARVGLFCDERDRSWCSGSSWNDHRAITIEVSNSTYGDNTGWPVSDKVYNKLIDLCVDICQRNGIKKLTYTGDKNGSLTIHSLYQSTCCPGPYLRARLNDICNKVNARLNVMTDAPVIDNNKTSQNTSSNKSNKIKTGDLVTISSNATYYTGTSIPSWVKSEKWYVSSVSGDRAVLGLNETKNRNIQSPVNTKFLTVVKVSSKKTYTVSLKSTDILYATAGGKTKGNVGTSGIFTIVEDTTVNGIKYGKLKSGAGWVKLSTTSTSTPIKKGDWVKVINNTTYDGKKFTVYASKYKVLELNGKRAVISSDGKNVTCAINIANIAKV